MLAAILRTLKRGRDEEPKDENQWLRPGLPGAGQSSVLIGEARKKLKGRRSRSVPPPRPVGSSRVNIKQVSLDEGFVVLTNDGRTGVAIDGWTLRSGSVISLTIPPETRLEPHTALLVVAPDARPPAALARAGMKRLRATAAWTSGLMLHNRDGVLIDGEGGASHLPASPFQPVISRAEGYYRTLVSQLVAQRLFAKSPNFMGPSHVNAKNVRLTHDAREELHSMLESVADRVLQHCKADSRSPLSASTMCVAIEEALPACDVQRRAVAEAARSSEHATLFLLTDAEVAEFAAHVESAKQLALSPEAAHAFAVALDYLLAELVETVATMAYSETSSGLGQGEVAPTDAELCTGALDKLALVTCVRMDPDLHKIFAAACSMSE
ncbi:hypothetical protein KFE25_001897 [Diacronema lutheri]|uniref:LTD domain-containing protein n=2 Tax=Diacronema lutheri TaxID=2081491 RepID=A0A8J5XKS8_DIALT|nr:hypothetical protein KFE25_001897 [Diacronema lutheri]|mmetsp:Transcript_19979/g.62128  ORF Transcript_19979/g.62128 Transcript_19979/m.62128 type:complete len:382 (+) Transcript_19979:14-1159(+)